MPSRRGVPSFTDRVEHDRRVDQVRTLGAVELGDTLESVHSALRAGRLDESVVERFFKRRRVGWRVLLESHLSGRTLAIGDHDEVLPLALAETTAEVWVADVDPASLEAVAAVASSTEAVVRPVHATVDDLPFPDGSFELIVWRGRADEVGRALSRLGRLLAPDGRLAAIVDGWTRELGLDALVGMAPAERAATEPRFAAAARAPPAAVRRVVERRGFAIERAFAVLTRGRHENELAFDAGSAGALTWLLDGFDATAAAEYATLRRVVRIARRSGLLSQCYPRYLYVCGRPPVEEGATDAVLLAGKNRTTVFELADGRLDRVRKVPNGRRHGAVNEAADRATRIASRVDSVADAVPEAERRTTIFGPERIERPLRGAPLDRLLDDRPDRFARCLDVAFDWIERLQRDTRTGTVRKEPSEVAADLAAERFGLTEPPVIDRPVELPRVLVHGDYFGSNVLVVGAATGAADASDVSNVAEWRVGGVIDWEWAKLGGNPVADAGFFALEAAAFAGGGDFERGFRRVFVENTPLSRILRDRIDEYCDTVGVAPDAFLTYLPIGYVERARADVRLNGRLDVDWPGRVETVWNRHDALARRFGVAPLDRSEK